jgi:trehalose 6-phosphate phosphatase
MEIHGAGIDRIHPEAAAARPLLERAAARIRTGLAEVPGAFLEDKGLTLSVHFRQAPDRADEVRRVVDDAVAGEAGLRTTAGKMVLEVRPRVEWDKGRAVLFLLEQMRPPAGAPVLYLGDDATDEDAFRALAAWRPEGEGVLVADHPAPDSAARAWLRSPEEVGALFAALAGAA